MSDHIHAWTPIDGEVARYSCACNATGYRARTGEIREHKTKTETRRRWTAVPGRTDAAGQIPARILEDWNGPKDREP